MTRDVKTFVKTCDKCQRVNDLSVPPTDQWVGRKIQPHSPKLFAEGGQ